MKVADPEISLHWAGKTRQPDVVAGRLRRIRAGHPSSLLIEGDNLAAMLALGRRRDTATLAYLDPPFLTGRVHQRVTRCRDESSGEILRTLDDAFDDRWTDLGSYLTELRVRLCATRDLLHDEGSLILHVDTKTSHYAKVVCDEIFGPRAFASEIIWRYRRWPSKTPNFQRVHDVLLRYVKNPEIRPRFNQLYEPLAASTRATWGDRKQRAIVGENGRRKRSSTTDSLSPGTPLGDVWEIAIVAPVAKERTGYPTQKPEALLERLVLACTNPGELVLDPYMGSGTTLAVCARLGRRAIGIDQNPDAVALVRARLEALGVSPREERAHAVSLAKPPAAPRLEESRLRAAERNVA